MSPVTIINTPDDYWDVFNTDTFTGQTGRPLNWLERSYRRKQVVTPDNPPDTQNEGRNGRDIDSE